MLVGMYPYFTLRSPGEQQRHPYFQLLQSMYIHRTRSALVPPLSWPGGGGGSPATPAVRPLTFVTLRKQTDSPRFPLGRVVCESLPLVRLRRSCIAVLSMQFAGTCERPHFVLIERGMIHGQKSEEG